MSKQNIQARRRELIEEMLYVLDARDVGPGELSISFLDGAVMRGKFGNTVPIPPPPSVQGSPFVIQPWWKFWR